MLLYSIYTNLIDKTKVNNRKISEDKVLRVSASRRRYSLALWMI